MAGWKFDFKQKGTIAVRGNELKTNEQVYVRETYVGSTFSILDPPNVVMNKLPSLSLVRPSSTRSGEAEYAMRVLAAYKKIQIEFFFQ